MAKKITRKQLLKEPDQFITFTGRMIAFAKENRKQLIGGVIAFVLALFITLGVKYYLVHNREESFSHLSALQQELNQMANEAPDKIYDVLSDKFKTFLKDYTGTKAGELGRIDYASIAINAGKSDEAVEMYKAALDETGPDSSYKDLILEGLASAYEQKGDLDNALKYNKMILDNNDPSMTDQANFNMGRLYEAKGDLEKSREYYKKISDNFYNKDIVSEKIAG